MGQRDRAAPASNRLSSPWGHEPFETCTYGKPSALRRSKDVTSDIGHKVDGKNVSTVRLEVTVLL